MKLDNGKKQIRTFPEKMMDKGNSFRISCCLNSWEDEKKTFFAIQVERYLKRKVQKRFCSDAERDVIEDIISEYWEYVKGDVSFNRDEKSRNNLYYSCIIVFPYFVAEEENIIPVDFNVKSVIHYSRAYRGGSIRESDDSEFVSF